MKQAKLGFLGCGNIGGGVWALLEDMRGDIARRYQLELVVKRMLVRALDEPRSVQVDTSRLTTDADDVLRDPEITIVCEFMGGEQPAAMYMQRALEMGKTVVTANKEALCLHWNALHRAAQKGDAWLYYEAAVCGAIPVIRAVRESMTGNRVNGITGILNGTTNYILTQMAENGLDYAQALAQAQALGLAEPEPVKDVDGHDAVYKLSILSSLCYGVRVEPSKCITRATMKGADKSDILVGKELGYALKHIARSQWMQGRVYADVQLTYVPLTHPLAQVSYASNGVMLYGHASGPVFMSGQGAGSLPTAGAILADILQAVQPGQHECFAAYDDAAAQRASDIRVAYCLYAPGMDAPSLERLLASRDVRVSRVQPLSRVDGSAALLSDLSPSDVLDLGLVLPANAKMTPVLGA